MPPNVSAPSIYVPKSINKPSLYNLYGYKIYPYLYKNDWVRYVGWCLNSIPTDVFATLVKKNSVDKLKSKNLGLKLS